MFDGSCSLENFLMDDLKVYIKDNINTYIDEVNAAYSDFQIDNIDVDDDAYQVYQEMVDIPNYPVYVIIDVGTESEVISSYGDGPLVLNTMVMIARCTGSEAPGIEYRTNLRYMEAVRLMMIPYDHIQLDSNKQVQRIMPNRVSIGKDSSMAETIISGVEIRYTLA